MSETNEIIPVTEQSAILITHIDNEYMNAFRCGQIHTNVPDIYKSFENDDIFTRGNGYASHIYVSPKGVWSSTREEALEVMKKSLKKEIVKLEKDGDLRPSQVQRLRLLKSVCGVV